MRPSYAIERIKKELLRYSSPNFDKTQVLGKKIDELPGLRDIVNSLSGDELLRLWPQIDDSLLAVTVCEGLLKGECDMVKPNGKWGHAGAYTNAIKLYAERYPLIVKSILGNFALEILEFERKLSEPYPNCAHRYF